MVCLVLRGGKLHTVVIRHWESESDDTDFTLYTISLSCLNSDVLKQAHLNTMVGEKPLACRLSRPRFALFFHGCLGEQLPDMASAIFEEGEAHGGEAMAQVIWYPKNMVFDPFYQPTMLITLSHTAQERRQA